jgi:pheromone a factor receptor
MPDIPFTVFSCIGFLLCIPLAYFNWKIPSRPLATSILIEWIFLLNLPYFSDSILWSDPNLANWWDGNVYCDINARLPRLGRNG